MKVERLLLSLEHQKTTLLRRLNGQLHPIAPACRPTVFTAEEECTLLGYILDMEKRGFVLNIQQTCYHTN